jgi:hypothetical protein
MVAGNWVQDDEIMELTNICVKMSYYSDFWCLLRNFVFGFNYNDCNISAPISAANVVL